VPSQTAVLVLYKGVNSISVLNVCCHNFNVFVRLSSDYLRISGAKLGIKNETTKLFCEKLIGQYKDLTFVYNSDPSGHKK
jgi:hypothetical protein